MSNPKYTIYTIIVDGCDYAVEVQGLREGATEGTPEVLWVYDCNGQRVADAEWDEADEAVHASYFDDDGRLEEFDSRMPDLYNKGWREVATWLVSTHPCN